jgi:hypothetical protein
MLWSVAGRFSLDGHSMPIGRLKFWYEGHVQMCKEEREAINKDGK